MLLHCQNVGIVLLPLDVRCTHRITNEMNILPLVEFKPWVEFKSGFSIPDCDCQPCMHQKCKVGALVSIRDRGNQTTRSKEQLD